MLISYYLGNKEYAARTRDLIPRKGDFVRFRSVPYEIIEVVWIEDEERERVAIQIKEID